MHRWQPTLRARWTLAFGLSACVAASCSLPLSHTCHTSDDCLSGQCLEGVCRSTSQSNDAGVSDFSIAGGADATADRHDAAGDRHVSLDGGIDATADPHDATTDQSIDSASPDGTVTNSAAADSAARDSSGVAEAGGGDASAAPDRPANDSSDDADAATSDAQGAAPPVGPPVPAACPAWPDWPMPAPATLTGVPDDPRRNLPNPASYDTSDPDVVVDNVTHLRWQRVVSTTARTYAQAASYCASLDLGGRRDWRLPSRIELFSLLDWDRSTQGNIDSVFTDPPSQKMWACTPGPAQPLIAWFVDFAMGGANCEDKTSTLLARCVSGSGSSTPPPARYQVGADGTVTDIKTLLTWQVNPSPGLVWGDAFEYCQGLGPGWRLPSVVEYETLLDETQVKSAVDSTAFPDSPDGFYWTSSFFNSDNLQAWFVSNGMGNTYWIPTSRFALARCVR